MIEKDPQFPSGRRILSLFPSPSLSSSHFVSTTLSAVSDNPLITIAKLSKAITLQFQSSPSLPLLTPSSTAMSKDLAGIRQALERARNCEDGTVDPQTTAVLEAAITELWTRIQADPDSYVLSRDEFALFNYFLERYRGSAVAQRAVARFWNNYHGSPNAGAK